MKKPSKTILGLDISTSITGASVIKDGKIIKSLFWDTRNKRLFPTLYEKADFIRRKFGIGYKLDIFGSDEYKLNEEEIEASVKKHIKNVEILEIF